MRSSQNMSRFLLHRHRQLLRPYNDSMIHGRLESMACLLHQTSSRRTKATSTAFLNLSVVPESIRESVKTSFLNEAVKHDSRLWRNDKNQVNGSLDGGVDQPLSTSLLDPLDDLYRVDMPRYFPNIPLNVSDAADPFALSKPELDSLSNSIREDLIGTSHPVLNQAASYFFDKSADSGKKIRPMMVMLLSRALADSVAATENNVLVKRQAKEALPNSSLLFTTPMDWQRPDLPQAQRRLAEISEMIHTASLFRK
jgi:hypothetical protein